MNDVNKIIKSIIQHECGHLLFYLKAIKKDKCKVRIIRHYNTISDIGISVIGGTFYSISYYMNKNDEMLFYLGGAIIDKYKNDYNNESCKSDFNYIKNLGYNIKEIENEINIQAKLITANEILFIDDMTDFIYNKLLNKYSKYHNKNISFKISYKISLKDMDEMICKHYPEFKNYLYVIPYKIE